MMKVLLIDDDVPLRSCLRQVLQQEGYDVKEASTGKEGLRLCQEDHILLVITDILMPDMDGMEFIQGVHQVCPQTKIVAISGGYQWAGPSMLDIAKRLGADLAYEKPFDLPQFLQGLRELGRVSV